MHPNFKDNYMMIVEFSGLKNYNDLTSHIHFMAVNDFGDKTRGCWYMAREHCTLIRSFNL